MYINLTLFEKKAIAKAIRLIITCDNKVSEGERQYLTNGVIPQIGLSNAEFEEAKNFDTELMRTVLKKLSKVNRIELLTMMLKMILIDGEVSDDEMKMFNSICLIGELDIDVKVSDIDDNKLSTWYLTFLYSRNL